MAITIHDLVVLGTAVPQEIRDGRKTVCVAGYHDDLGLIRLYPTRVRMGLHRWHKVSVTVERNRQDTRVESWKLAHSKEWDLLQVDAFGGELARDDRMAIVERHAASCPRELDSDRKSLAILRAPTIEHCAFVANRTEPPQQPRLLPSTDDFVATRADYEYIPKLVYRCAAGCKHEATVVDWGAYEWMRKHRDKLDGYWENVHVMDAAWTKHLLIGNQCNARTSWIVIAIIAFKTGSGQRASGVQLTLA